MIFHLYVGTTKDGLYNMKKGKFNKLTFLSDNLETMAHYYEGAAALIEINLDICDDQGYCNDENNASSDYKWGYMFPTYPKNATWFSISDKYMKEHLLNIDLLPDELLNSILQYYASKE